MAAEHSARDILAASASLYLDDALDRESHTWYVDGVDKKMERHFTSVDKFLVCDPAFLATKSERLYAQRYSFR